MTKTTDELQEGRCSVTPLPVALHNRAAHPKLKLQG